MMQIAVDCTGNFIPPIYFCNILSMYVSLIVLQFVAAAVCLGLLARGQAARGVAGMNIQCSLLRHYMWLMLYVQAAAGIVADSDPEMEWLETEAKARAVLRAAEQVQNGLDQPF